MNGLGTTYIKTYMRAKNVIKKNVTTAFFNETEQLYLETDALGVWLGKDSAREGQNVVPKELSTRQCSAATNSFCQQNLKNCRNLL